MEKKEAFINNASKIKNIFLFIAISLLFNNCVEEITFNESSFNNLLVVNATLTDEYKNHEVILSKISTLNAEEDIDTYEENAMVSIIEDSNKIHEFQEKANGVYESIIPFKAELGKQYSLHVKTADGEIYESTLEKIQGINDIDEINVEPDTDFYGVEGLTISVKSTSTDKSAKYYKYTYSETYKIIAPFYSQYALKIISDVYPWKIKRYFQNEDRKVCYNTIESIKILQTETNSLSENTAILPLRFIKKNDSIIAHRYSIEVKQYVQSYEAYSYFKTLSKLSNSENVFSQSQQGFLQGNITATKNDKKVVGFFEVSSVSKKRLFFNLTDVFPDHFINTTESCDLYAPPLTEYDEGKPFTDFSPLINLLKSGFLYFGDNHKISPDKPGSFLIVQKRCGDCRIYGTIIKPSFWID